MLPTSGRCCWCALLRSSGWARLKTPSRPHAAQRASRPQCWSGESIRFAACGFFFAFGGYVALSVWLPRYLIGVYGLNIRMSAAITTHCLPACVASRAEFFPTATAARRVMYWSFIGSLVCIFILSYPPTDYIVHGLRGDHRFSIATGLPVFISLLMIQGFFMALGKIAVFKHISAYFPEEVGVVGGAVGAIDGLGGFLLPLAFGLMNDIADVWTSCFMLFFGIGSVSLIWMHFAIRRQQRAAAPEIADFRFLPELQLSGTELVRKKD